jgi:hypothetical protein
MRFAGENFKKGTTPIVEIYYGDPYLKRKVDETITQKAKDVLRQSSERYNIKNAANFEGLCAAIEALGGLQGTGKFYSSGELIEKIQKVKQGIFGLEHLTRRGGLRKKVEEFLAEK